MRITAIVTLVLLILQSCTNRSGKNQDDVVDNSSNSIVNGDVTKTVTCFVHTEGIRNQDTTRVQLNIMDNEVRGSMKHIPHEKDSRMGHLQGTIRQDRIKALWTFIQEGKIDTLTVEFKLSNGELLQKTYSIDPANGRQFLSDTSRFLIRFIKTECSPAFIE